MGKKLALLSGVKDRLDAMLSALKHLSASQHLLSLTEEQDATPGRFSRRTKTAIQAAAVLEKLGTAIDHMERSDTESDATASQTSALVSKSSPTIRRLETRVLPLARRWLSDATPRLQELLAREKESGAMADSASHALVR